jgi:hypothetical protein
VGEINSHPFDMPRTSARILAPASKIATTSSLGAILELDDIDEDHLDDAMDWLLSRTAGKNVVSAAG